MDTSGKFFDGFADTFDTLYDGKRRPVMQWIDKRFRSDMFIRFELAFSLLGDISGKRLLDIGCGSGPYIAEALRQGVAHVTGIDPAPRMLELTRQRVEKLGKLESVTLLEGYFPATSPQETFDHAIVMGVMDYVAEPVSFIKALNECVTDKSSISFPSTHWFRTPFRKMRYRIRRCPVYFYNTQSIERIMKEAGTRQFTINKISGAGMDFVVCLNG
jgi:2-polyprenyl-3-methyl-5-hydroxy-6-metoxy-1,4-benzoquinol methylase